ncbi:MAG: hypothetical protein QOD88_3701 [Mycobacterium sp.]|nr:hypothetical protein [Mycobacterium sp.]
MREQLRRRRHRRVPAGPDSQFPTWVRSSAYQLSCTSGISVSKTLAATSRIRLYDEFRRDAKCAVLEVVSRLSYVAKRTGIVLCCRARPSGVGAIRDSFADSAKAASRGRGSCRCSIASAPPHGNRSVCAPGRLRLARPGRRIQRGGVYRLPHRCGLVVIDDAAERLVAEMEAKAVGVGLEQLGDDAHPRRRHGAGI